MRITKNKKTRIKKQVKIPIFKKKYLKKAFVFIKKINWSAKNIAILSFIISLIISLIIINSKGIFYISQINCYELDKQCSQKYQDDLHILFKQSVFKPNFKEIKRLFKYSYPEIDSITYTIKWPNTINIYIQPRIAFAIIQDINQHKLIIDEKGRVFKKYNQENLPIININETFSIGEKISTPILKQTIKLLSILYKSQISVAYLKPGIEDIEGLLYTNHKVYFSIDKDLYKQVDALQFIITNSKISKSNLKFSEIDLRYKNPVLR